jgi:hypothetical protein
VAELVPNDASKQERVMRIISAKLHQSYDNFQQPPANYNMRMKVDSVSLVGVYPPPVRATDASLGFLAKLQQQRTARPQTGLGLA